MRRGKEPGMETSLTVLDIADLTPVMPEDQVLSTDYTDDYWNLCNLWIKNNRGEGRTAPLPITRNGFRQKAEVTV